MTLTRTPRPRPCPRHHHRDMSATLIQVMMMLCLIVASFTSKSAFAFSATEVTVTPPQISSTGSANYDMSTLFSSSLPSVSTTTNNNNNKAAVTGGELKLPSASVLSIKREAHFRALSSTTTTGDEFTIESILENETSNPWCLDAYQCSTTPGCSGSNVILRPCDPAFEDTQYFVNLNSFLYLAKQMDYCLQVQSPSMLLTVVSCTGSDVLGTDMGMDTNVNATATIATTTTQNKNNSTKIQIFKITKDGKLLAIDDEGKRYGAKLKYDPNDTEEKYKIQFEPLPDPELLKFNQKYHPPTFVCYDTDKLFYFRKNKNGKKIYKTCMWIGNNVNQRCKRYRVKKACPITCGVPNECTESCRDITTQFQIPKNKKWRTCDFLTTSPNMCKINVFRSNCPVSCGVCLERRSEY